MYRLDYCTVCMTVQQLITQRNPRQVLPIENIEERIKFTRRLQIISICKKHEKNNVDKLTVTPRFGGGRIPSKSVGNIVVMPGVATNVAT